MVLLVISKFKHYYSSVPIFIAPLMYNPDLPYYPLVEEFKTSSNGT